MLEAPELGSHYWDDRLGIHGFHVTPPVKNLRKFFLALWHVFWHSGPLSGFLTLFLPHKHSDVLCGVYAEILFESHHSYIDDVHWYSFPYLIFFIEGDFPLSSNIHQYPCSFARWLWLDLFFSFFVGRKHQTGTLSHHACGTQVLHPLSGTQSGHVVVLGRYGAMEHKRTTKNRCMVQLKPRRSEEIELGLVAGTTSEKFMRSKEARLVLPLPWSFLISCVFHGVSLGTKSETTHTSWTFWVLVGISGVLPASLRATLYWGDMAGEWLNISSKHIQTASEFGSSPMFHDLVAFISRSYSSTSARSERWFNEPRPSSSPKRRLGHSLGTLMLHDVWLFNSDVLYRCLFNFIYAFIVDGFLLG